MDLRETWEIMAILETVYPGFYKNTPDEDLDGVAALWQSMFMDEPLPLVAAAVKALIAVKVEGYPPTIGAVKEQIAKLTQVEQLSELDAWALVCKACQNGYYGYKEEFEKLPEVVQRSIGSAEQLRIWSQMDEDTVNSVVASNFMRTFKAKQKQQKELDMLPSDVKKVFESAAEKKRLEAAKERQKKLAAQEIKKLEAPKEETAAVIPMVIPKDLFPEAEPYKPPSDEEWEKKRDAAMSMLAAAHR